MSSDEDQPDGISVPAKKRRVQRACDMCRLKKRACDGLRMSEKKCTNCVENGVDCTFAGAVAKRRGYIDALEARLEMTEQLLRKLSPQGAAPAAATNASPSPASSQWSSDSPVTKHRGDAAAVNTLGPGVELAILTIRSMNTPAPAPDGDDLAHIELTKDLSDLTIEQHHERFHGKSSAAMLVKAAVRLREGYEEKATPWHSRRMHYWTFNPAKDRIPHVGPYIFPEDDLLRALIGLYFVNVSHHTPLLHRPTFERAIVDGLHTRDASFGAVVLLVCAIASRFSDDVRACPPGTDPLRCGWQYFDQLPNVVDHLFVRPTLYQMQYYCLATSFLAFSRPTACWALIGLGIRMAQDVGAHRARNLGSAPTVESESWKRAFWVLVCLDRVVSDALGRPCTTQYEDFDVELPIECDDEYFENANPALAFKQPNGKPSRIAFFNSFIRLNNILAFSLKMLYSLNKTKNLLAVRDEAWEEHIVAELDSALNGWVDSIPAHLRWDPNRQDDVFFDQSAYLYCTYYQLQMTIHRPFIPMIRQGASTALPSLAICTNAARMCSHVSDISRQRKNGTPTPVLVSSTFTSGVVLLLNVWSGKRTGLPPEMTSTISEVHKCMECIRVCEGRWQSAGLFWDLLYQLAAIGQVPLPRSSPPAENTRPSGTTGVSSSNKRGRADDTAQYPRRDAAVAHHPSPYGDMYSAPPTPAPPPAFHPTPQQQFAFAQLPTYTADLGRLPVFHQYNDSSSNSLYPAQTSASAGYPDFATGGAAPDNYTNAFNSDPPASAPMGGYNFGAGADGMDTDSMAMWAHAPTGFEVDDWGTYFSVMSELREGRGVAGGPT
ncbi:fungal-specific transcription factor domain-containing protein [Mycena epipterygia]|nr:fungal-specific transcription factor domain-containing protein [Mycena epipterygia]